MNKQEVQMIKAKFKINQKVKFGDDFYKVSGVYEKNQFYKISLTDDINNSSDVYLYTLDNSKVMNKWVKESDIEEVQNV
jgi:hypothetical protein